MSTERTAERAEAREAASVKPIVNEFSLVVATVNGSGSQTSNMAIMRALFRMGIPVSGKNLFPSNIQGLPTWFTIRANAAGFLARQEHADILVAMNAATYLEDIGQLVPGGVCFYSDAFSEGLDRTDITYYPMPVQDLLRDMNPPKDLRDYIANMAYVGIVSQMLGIELEQVRGALMTHFQGKVKAVDLNMRMVDAAAEWARGHLVKTDPYTVRPDHKTSGKILWMYTRGLKSTAECPLRPGIPSRRPRVWRRPCRSICQSSASTPRPGLPPMPSFRPKTRWRRWGWPSAPAGWGQGR
jgi:2-oxoglutarate ferredoxin oxidoreductase subunit alpha